MARPADSAHRAAQRALATATAASLADLIGVLPEPRSQGAMDAYNGRAWRVVAGAQLRSAQVAIAYMSLVVPFDRRELTPTPANAIAAAGVAVTADSPVARSPILRLWKLIDDGVDIAEAKLASSSYADELASTDLHVAQRAGLESGARAAHRHIGGWRKDLSADACDWCRRVAGRTYRSADSVPFHSRDNCSVAPILEEDSV